MVEGTETFAQIIITETFAQIENGIFTRIQKECVDGSTLAAYSVTVNE